MQPARASKEKQMTDIELWCKAFDEYLDDYEMQLMGGPPVIQEAAYQHIRDRRIDKESK